MSVKAPKIGFIFPGQGSQHLGMCKDFYDKERIVQEYFEQAANCVGQNFVQLCFAGSEESLRDTVNAQTSIFLASAAICELLKKKYEIVPDIVAGNSSGEYAAIFAAGGMSFYDTIYLLKKRATFMNEATKQFNGGLLAVIGVNLDELKSICRKFDVPEGTEFVAEIVTQNSSNQFVVSGTIQALMKVKDEVATIKGKAIFLNVAGAFHSRLMESAAMTFAMYMTKVDLKNLSVPLVNNISAEIILEQDDLKKSITTQMNSPVKWWPSMQHFEDCNVIVEIGPGDKLAKMLKKEWPDKKIFSVNKPEDIENLLSVMGKKFEKVIHETDCEVELCAKDDIVVVDEGKSDENITCSDDVAE
jgi:[acyl-carrier-protein] S-malonyltransferase